MKASEAFLAWIDGEAVQIEYGAAWWEVLHFFSSASTLAMMVTIRSPTGHAIVTDHAHRLVGYRIAPPTEGGGS